MSIDTNLLSQLHFLADKNGFLGWLAVFFASYIQYVLGLLFLIFIWKKISTGKKWQVFLTGIAAIILSRGIITTIIRFFYHRTRPFLEYNFVPLVPETDYSFPSGHMTFFFALSTVIYIHDKKWGIWFMTASALMGIARIAAGVHWPSDIVGGAAIGIAVGWLMAYIFKKYWNKKPLQNETA